MYSSDEVTAGDYTLHVESVKDPGSTISTAKHLYLDDPAGGTIDSTEDVDFFRLDLTETKNLYLYARSVYGHFVAGLEVNRQLKIVGRNQYQFQNRFLIRDEFSPGTHFIYLTRAGLDTPYAVPYTIHVLEDTYYDSFLQYCENQTVTNSPQVGDTLYGCQWHLRNLVRAGHRRGKRMG